MGATDDDADRDGDERLAAAAGPLLRRLPDGTAPRVVLPDGRGFDFLEEAGGVCACSPPEAAAGHLRERHWRYDPATSRAAPLTDAEAHRQGRGYTGLEPERPFVARDTTQCRAAELGSDWCLSNAGRPEALLSGARRGELPGPHGSYCFVLRG